MQQTIPVVSLRDYHDAARRTVFVDRFGKALEEYGFVAIEDYGIAPDQFARTYDVFRAFFNLTRDAKAKYERPETGRRRGYTSFGVEHAKDHATPDLKEFFHVGRETGDARIPHNVWPDEISSLRATAGSLYAALDEVAMTCLEAMSRYLDVPPDTLPNLARGGNTVLRVIHYPVCDGFSTPGAMRAAQHEDINLMTLLPPADESGLEILTRDGEWLAIQPVPGQIIADTGDMMMRITGDRIPSTTHRVVNPQGEPTPRYSMPFFVHPHVDATLSVLPSCVGDSAPKYPPVPYEQFLMERLEAIGLTS